jgi:putative DNA primase/helicase
MFVDSILSMSNEFFFKTPTQGKVGDLIWRYDNGKGIWLPDGNTWVEKQVAATLGKKVKQRNLSETVKLFQVATYCKPEDFQEDVGSVCLQNGELELGSYVTKEFNPEHNHKNQLPIKYDPEADCPNFKKFLTEVAPGDEDSFQELFGYFLVQSYPIQKCFILQGSGANGKSTLLRVMEAFLGKENCSLRPRNQNFQ